jgi:AcrR family transcriptional regulator
MRPKQQLLQTALRLFYRDGFHRTGVDRIIAEAGVAKMTLYNHFGTKEQLILETLRLHDSQWLERFAGRVDELGAGPQGKLLAALDALAEWIASPDFRGCLFMHAAAEFPHLGDPIHQLASDHKRRVFEWIRRQVLELGIADVDATAKQIHLLMEGAIANAYVSGDTTTAGQAKRAARILLECTK